MNQKVLEFTVASAPHESKPCHGIRQPSIPKSFHVPAVSYTLLKLRFSSRSTAFKITATLMRVADPRHAALIVLSRSQTL